MTNHKEAYFPLFINLSKQKIVVIGAGKIATRRILTLSQFTNQITVVAIQTSDEIKALAKTRQVILHEKEYERHDIDDADIVLAATDDRIVNDEIYVAAKAMGILVNVASDKDKCDFHFPGIVKKQQLVVGVNASGENHKRVKTIREKIEQLLDEEEEMS